MIRVFAGIAAGLLLTACANASTYLLKLQPRNAATTAIQGMDAACSRRYGDDRIAIVEMVCGTKGDGLYLISGSRVTRYDWYDPRFNEWAATEGCATDDACYYRVEVDARGRITAFTYVFRINLSEGEYRVSVERGRLRVQAKRIKDAPS